MLFENCNHESLRLKSEAFFDSDLVFQDCKKERKKSMRYKMTHLKLGDPEQCIFEGSHIKIVVICKPTCELACVGSKLQ